MTSKWLLLMLCGTTAQLANYSYDSCSATGPQSWGGQCHRPDGSNQTAGSPIDLCGAVPFPSPSPTITKVQGYDSPAQYLISDDGHGLQLNIPPGANVPSLQLGDVAAVVERSNDTTVATWVLEYVRFHWGRSMAEGSEHLIEGHRFPLEVQAMHYNAEYANFSAAVAANRTDALLGLAVMFVPGAENNMLRAVASELPTITSAPTLMKSKVVLSAHFNSKGPFYAYAGSLTTFGCDEIVTWVVFREPMTASQMTLDLIRSAPLQAGNFSAGLISDLGNWRPVQPRNNRTVFVSDGNSSICRPESSPPPPCGNVTLSGILGALGCVNGVSDCLLSDFRTVANSTQFSGALMAAANAVLTVGLGVLLDFVAGARFLGLGGIVKGLGRLRFFANSTLEVAVNTTLQVFVEFQQGAAIAFLDAVALYVQRGSSMNNITVTGNGTLYFQGLGQNYTVNISKCLLRTIKLVLKGAAASTSRRIDTSSYSTTIFCGSSASSVTVGAQAAAVFQSDCSVSTSYSNSIDTLVSSDASGLIAFTNLSPTSLPTYIGTWSNSSTTPLGVSLTSTSSAFTTLVAVSASPEVCTAAPSTTVDGCTSGFTCSVTRETYNSNQCAIRLTQSASSSSSGGSGSSNPALYGLFALFALIPIAALAVWCVMRRRKAPAAEAVEPYDFAEYKDAAAEGPYVGGDYSQPITPPVTPDVDFTHGPVGLQTAGHEL